MIPKTIHYCWFGRNPKPELAEKCIKSWKKKCPDYEIIEWNEDNFDIASSPLYVRQAYEAKKWAFVTDYVRLWALTTYGGIYMDTDVQVLKSLDPFLKHQAFSGFEDETHIPTGIMACEKGFPLFTEMISFYNDAEFVNQDGSYNYKTNVILFTDLCTEKGLRQDNTLQTVDGFTLYPKDVFCPVSYMTRKLEKTKNTVTIHWFAGTWLPEGHRERIKQAIIQEKRNRRAYYIHLPKRIARQLLGQKSYDQIKRWLKG